MNFFSNALHNIRSALGMREGPSELEPRKFEITQEQAQKMAGAAVLIAAQVHGKELNYSPESLALVDEIVLKLREEGHTLSTINNTVVFLGCYVGEVFIRNLGFNWAFPGVEERAVGFEYLGIRNSQGLFSNPIGKVSKRLQNGAEDSVAHLYQAVDGRTLKV
jgi:hypothetical protein